MNKRQKKKGVKKLIKDMEIDVLRMLKNSDPKIKINEDIGFFDPKCFEKAYFGILKHHGLSHPKVYIK